MENKNFHTFITVNVPQREVISKINRVDKWWAKDFSGKAEKLNDKFTIRFGSTFVDFEISELVSNKKVVWKVTNCFLPWLKNKTEWNNTVVVYEVSSANGSTKINFTHVGLVPNLECYEQCENGWTRFVTVSLPKYLETGVGLPE
jgi:hypothetical protein